MTANPLTMTPTARPGEAPIAEREVLAALHDVVDPELDESIVELGFVEQVHVDGDDVTVRLRLPTFWCAANFAYLMARDTYDRVLGLPGVGRARVVLADHFASDEISAGVSAGLAFDEVFPGEAEGDLEELRTLFQMKGLIMRQEQVIRLLWNAGLSADEIVRLRVGDVQAGADGTLTVQSGSGRCTLLDGASQVQTYLDRRRRVGLDTSLLAPLVTDEYGLALLARELSEHLSRGRRQRISIVLNTTFCRGLLETRYGEAGALDTRCAAASSREEEA